jgi:thiamine transport system substrate-binding protein
MSRLLVLLLTLAALLSACGGGQSTAPTAAPTSAAAPTDAVAPTAVSEPAAPTTAPEPTEEGTAPTAAAIGGELRVMTHDSFSISDDVIAEFEQQAGVKVSIIQSGDAGAMLNKAILSKDAPIADLIFGVDNTFMSRALDADLLETYAAPALANIPAIYQLDPSNHLLPIDYGYVVINYDKNYLEQNGLVAPASLRDLTKPEWKSLLVVENPSTSSPGLAFLLATIATFGSEGDYTWLNYWQDLRANDVLVVDGWSDAYYTHFSGSSGQGPRPLVVSYATSPAAEVYYSEGKLEEPPTANLLDGGFLQVEFAGILKGAQRPELAQQFIDFMLSARFQEDIPLQMFVYPVVSDTALPEVFTKFAPTPEQAANIAPAEIEQNRERWIDEWTQAVLR